MKSPSNLSIALGDDARSNGQASLTKRESKTLLEGHGLVHVQRDGEGIAGHGHLDVLRQMHLNSHSSSSDESLRAVIGEERLLAATLFLLEDVDVGIEIVVGLHRSRHTDDLSSGDVTLLDTLQHDAALIASLTLVQSLVEHLDTDDLSLHRLLLHSHDLHGLAGLDDASLDAASGDGALGRDGEDALDAHEERLVHGARRLRDEGIHLLHELVDGRDAILALVAVEGLECRASDEGSVITGELVHVQHLSNFQLDQIHELHVFDHVHLVQEDNDSGHSDLPREQDVLTSLWHGAIVA
mmetsp:Transcript_12172/g.26580  ORF Transcript_12172/g.26580 Transcript_12172/m.26580 type:complete len:298 (+) Transcript_12172:147-1040(+)